MNLVLWEVAFREICVVEGNITTRYKLFRTHNVVRQFLVCTYSSALCPFSSEEDWKEVWSCRYLFIFLKFVASVIPTIDYDYTVDFDLGGH